MTPELYEIAIEAADAGERLDRVLAARGLAASRAVLQRWMDEGRVTIDGRPVAPKDKARAGTVVRIEPGPPPVSDALPEAIPLEVLYEDAALIVLHKPAGLVVHPAAGHEHGTLVNALLHHAQVERGEDPRRPGVVHRLDKDTSGVMVVARTDAAREALTAQFAEHTIEREYQAICVGVPPPALRLETWIGRHPTDRKRFSSKVRTGKRAVTHVTRERELHGAALLRCRLETGRTHQIRVHLADYGHPLLGDPLYGKPPKDPSVRTAATELGRQALHARLLGFTHPTSGERLRFEVAPPADFARALAQLER
ncbi:MAG TPA: RluA family pseudouridine synthase [Polyangiaceae bacterium]|nr:RluA family pseudouridine synthase [Polyangiaceae bacterium]